MKLFRKSTTQKASSDTIIVGNNSGVNEATDVRLTRCLSSRSCLGY